MTGVVVRFRVIRRKERKWEVEKNESLVPRRI